MDREKQVEAALVALAQLTVWYGEEDNAAYFRRLLSAAKIVNRLAPEAVKAEKAKVKLLDGN